MILNPQNLGMKNLWQTYSFLEKGSFLVFLAVFFAAFFGCHVQAAAARHVLVIGCDGFGSIGLTASNSPVLHGLMREGAWTLHDRGVMPTSSSPNWASMIMGAGPEQHGVTSNEWETNKFEIAPSVVGSGGMFPTIFGVLREQKPGIKIACVHDWDGFGRLLEPRAPDLLQNVKGSPDTAKRARQVIKDMKPTFMFVHFDEVDHAGHEHGWRSKEYFEAVEEVDSLIGGLLLSLKEAGIYQDTIVFMTADHGGKETHHGGLSMDELEIPLIIVGPGIRRGHEIRQQVNTFDLAPTVARLLGAEAPSCWIGRVVEEAFESSAGQANKP